MATPSKIVSLCVPIRIDFNKEFFCLASVAAHLIKSGPVKWIRHVKQRFGIAVSLFSTKFEANLSCSIATIARLNSI